MKTICICLAALSFICWANAVGQNTLGNCDGEPVEVRDIVAQSKPFDVVSETINFAVSEAHPILENSLQQQIIV